MERHQKQHLQSTVHTVFPVFMLGSTAIFADDQVSQAPNFNDEQKEDIRYIRTQLGDLADFQKICSDPQFAAQKAKLEDIQISFRQVLGTPEEVRRVF